MLADVGERRISSLYSSASASAASVIDGHTSERSRVDAFATLSETRALRLVFFPSPVSYRRPPHSPPAFSPHHPRTRANLVSCI